MGEYRTSAHAVFDIKYHFVWITKYRYKILRGLAERARDLLRQICQARDAVIVRGAVSPDHIHMLASLSGGYCASEAGAVPEGSFVAKAAGRISGTAKAVLEAAPVGASYFCASVAPWTRRRSKWTDQIMTEVNRNLAENFGLTDEQVAHRGSEIRRHFPEAWVEGHEDLISAMANHPKDRHVLSAAVRCNAKVIVTHNVKDLPRTALKPYSSRVRSSATSMSSTRVCCGHA